MATIIALDHRLFFYSMNCIAPYSMSRITRTASYLALLAMLLLALAPTLSKVIAHHTGGPDFVQLCTSHGMSWVASASLGDQQNPPTQKQITSAHSCPYCAAQLSTFIETQPVQFGQPVYQLLRRLDPPGHAAAQLAPTLSPSQARAPPKQTRLV